MGKGLTEGQENLSLKQALYLSGREPLSLLRKRTLRSAAFGAGYDFPVIQPVQ